MIIKTYIKWEELVDDEELLEEYKELIKDKGMKWFKKSFKEHMLRILNNELLLTDNEKVSITRLTVEES